MRRNRTLLESLRSIEILRDVPERHLRELVGLVDEVDLAPGTVLIHQGQLNRHAYFIGSGSVRVEVDGSEVATVAQGSIVGERTAIDRGLANATVTTAEPTTVYAVDHRALLGTAANDPGFSELIHDLARGRTQVAA
jgi:CRP-like cAMP-binding protein